MSTFLDALIAAVERMPSFVDDAGYLAPNAGHQLTDVVRVLHASCELAGDTAALEQAEAIARYGAARVPIDERLGVYRDNWLAAWGRNGSAFVVACAGYSDVEPTGSVAVAAVGLAQMQVLEFLSRHRPDAKVFFDEEPGFSWGYYPAHGWLKTIRAWDKERA